MIRLTIENEYPGSVDLDENTIANDVITAAIDYVSCPYECQVEVILVDNDTIQVMNREQRQINRPTDVLSFPMIEYDQAGEFSCCEDRLDLFDLDTKALVLGDIVISMDKVYAQAKEYGHSKEREFAFLLAHSMLHLFGYDHIDDEEREVMERMQEEILTKTNYTRNKRGLDE